MLAEHHSLKHPGELSQCNSTSGFLGREGVDQRTFGPAATPLPIRSPSRIPVEKRGAMQLLPQVPELGDHNPQRMVKIGSKSMSPQCINLEGYG